MSIRTQAIELRKQGKSYNEINKLLDVPKSTLSYWLKDIKLSQAQKAVLEGRSRTAGINALISRNIAQTEKARLRAFL